MEKSNVNEKMSFEGSISKFAISIRPLRDFVERLGKVMSNNGKLMKSWRPLIIPQTWDMAPERMILVPIVAAAIVLVAVTAFSTAASFRVISSSYSTYSWAGIRTLIKYSSSSQPGSKSLNWAFTCSICSKPSFWYSSGWSNLKFILSYSVEALSIVQLKL